MKKSTRTPNPGGNPTRAREVGGTPNPGGAPDGTTKKKAPSNWNKIGPGSWGGGVVGDKIFHKQGFVGHGNQRGR